MPSSLAPVACASRPTGSGPPASASKSRSCPAEMMAAAFIIGK